MNVFSLSKTIFGQCGSLVRDQAAELRAAEADHSVTLDYFSRHANREMPQDVARRDDAHEFPSLAHDGQVTITTSVHTLHGKSDLRVGDQRLWVGRHELTDGTRGKFGAAVLIFRSASRSLKIPIGCWPSTTTTQPIPCSTISRNTSPTDAAGATVIGFLGTSTLIRSHNRLRSTSLFGSGKCVSSRGCPHCCAVVRACEILAAAIWAKGHNCRRF